MPLRSAGTGRAICYETNPLDACDFNHHISAGRRPALLAYGVVCTDEEALNWKAEDMGNPGLRRQDLDRPNTR